MANTFIEYTGNGSTTNYSFTFEYIKQAEVKVTLDGAATTAFSFANATTLSFTTAPASGVKIRIYRETDVSSLKATFFPGSAIKAEDLNDNFTQNNFAVEEVRESTWDVDTETIKSNETWVSSDDQIATTAAMDARFQDEVSETFTKAELAANSNVMPNNDTALPTTGALNDYIDEVITNDIGSSDGVTITDDGDGTITVGLGASSVDLDRIKNSDIITSGEQDAGSPAPSDNNIFTAYAAARRFDGLVQTGTPSGSDWETGKLWLQNDNDKTLHMWNGSMWLPLVSGGSFTKLSKVIYVDSINGDDTLDGHRISNPKKTIKAAVADINSDSDGDGSLVIVAPGIYGETFPIDIQKNDVGIVGTALRNCIIHPAIPAADQAGYDVNVPEANELTTMFRVNSGSYFYGLTLTGMKASGTRGGNSLDTDSTYGIPTNQGWNFAFYPNAQIKKSPYIQNCTNFSDSRINNVNFTPHTPGEGAAGDLTSSPTGGGILVNGATVASNSPLRSIVADSYTHTALDGPGIFVTNNGYTQITSSYAFFNHYHIKCLNGGQANLAASTSDFGRYGLLVDGRSTSAIFTATTTATAADGAITFTIGAPTAGANWHGSATRPQGNMLVDIGGNTYPILSAVAAGSGWTVTISRPNPNKRDENLGLDGAVSSGATVNFYLRSMIASSGHTMEYVGSGTDYRALPENGGVPVEANQVVELNNGKVWTATTDHNGKFKVGDFFTVDQRTGFVTVPVGSISFPKLAEDLVVNGHEITSESNGNVVINPDGTGIIELGSNVGIGTSSPTEKLHVKGSSCNVVSDSSSNSPGVFATNNTRAADVIGGQLIGRWDGNDVARVDLRNGTDDVNKNNGAIQFATADGGNPTEKMRILANGNVGIGTATPSTNLHVSGTPQNLAYFENNKSACLVTFTDSSSTNSTQVKLGSVGNHLRFDAGGSERVRITSTGNVGIGTSSPNNKLHVYGGQIKAQSDTSLAATDYDLLRAQSGSSGTALFSVRARDTTDNNTDWDIKTNSNEELSFTIGGATESMRIKSNGNVGIGTSAAATTLELGTATPVLRLNGTTDGANVYADIAKNGGDLEFISRGGSSTNGSFSFINYDGTTETTALKIASNGQVGIGDSTPSVALDILAPGDATLRIKSSGTGSGDNAILQIRNTNNQANGYIYFGDDDDANAGQIRYQHNVNMMSFNTNGSEKMRLNSEGRLGIGATSPDQLLHIHEQSSGSVYLKLSNNDTGQGSGDGFVVGYDSNEHAMVWNRENTSMRFATNGSEKLRITNGGLLGLGTTTPSAQLEVSGTVTSGVPTLYLNRLANQTDTSDIALVGNSVIRGDDSIKKVVNDGGIFTWNVGGTDVKAGMTGASEKMRLNASGHLGIGTASPQAGRAPLHLHNGGSTTNVHLTNNTSGSGSQDGLTVFMEGTTSAGLWYREAGSLRFATNNSEKVRVDSDGRLLLGYSAAKSPVGFPHLFQIEGTASTSSSLSITRSDTTIGGTLTLAKANGGLGASGAVTANETIGQILFNGANGSNRNNYSARIQSIAAGTFTTSSCPADLRFEVCASGNVAPTERMRITHEGVHHIYSSAGVLGIRTTQGSGTTNVFISARHSATGVVAGGTIAFEVKTNGNVVNTNNSYGAISDIKLKENIVDASSQWDDIKALRPVNYNFKEGQTHTQLGLIAQEVEVVSPGLVTESPDRDDEGNDLGTVTKSVNYSVLYMKAVKALQEAMERIETLEAKVTALESN